MAVQAGRFIRTVRGDVAAEDWGVTNMHSHLVLDLFESSDKDPLYEDFRLTPQQMAPELAALREAGGFALVECTPRGVGRDVSWMRTAAERTGLQIVAGAGIYHERFHTPDIAASSDDELEAAFVDEVETGLDGTDIRAGIIGELGTNDERVTPEEERVFRAAARAALRTGVAVSTHTHLGGLAEEQLEILTGEGLSSHRVVIGHLDDVPVIDLELCRRVAERGAYVQFDGAGCEYFSETIGSQMPSDEERLRAVLALAEAGFASQVLLASDICRGRHLVVNGGPGLVHFADAFVKTAKRMLGEELARVVLVDNPREVLALERSSHAD